MRTIEEIDEDIRLAQWRVTMGDTALERAMYAEQLDKLLEEREEASNDS